MRAMDMKTPACCIKFRSKSNGTSPGIKKTQNHKKQFDFLGAVQAILGTRSNPAKFHTGPGPWSLVLGPWSLVLGPLVPVPWSPVLVPGPGPWSLVPGP